MKERNFRGVTRWTEIVLDVAGHRWVLLGRVDSAATVVHYRVEAR